MKYIVIELQKYDDHVDHILTKHDTLKEAESKFHNVLSAAAVSAVPVHSAVLMTDEGKLVRPTECYKDKNTQDFV